MQSTIRVENLKNNLPSSTSSAMQVSKMGYERIGNMVVVQKDKVKKNRE